VIAAAAGGAATGTTQSLFSGSQPKSSASSSGAAPVITIDPLPTYVVSRVSGFVAKGTVQNLGANTIWLFDHVGNNYYIDVSAIVNPRAHTWSASDRNLGDPSDPLPFNLTAVVVIASPECTYDLQIDFNSGNTKMPDLPAGCSTINPPIVVTVGKK
jgi:hypothetical protein